MKLVKSLVWTVCLVSAWNAFGAAELKDEKAKLSYSIGMNVGRAIKQQNMDVDLDVLAQAIRDILGGKETSLNEQEAREFLVNYQRDAARKITEKNKAESDTWLAENAKKEGIVKTASGLQYQIVTEGTGAKPTASDTVQVHYRGTLTTGTEFDNSYKSGAPREFPVTGVIKGWTEALQLMPVGSKWKLFIPPDLAYGQNGRPNIPPNSVLLFDIELVGIKDKSAAAAENKTETKKPEVKPIEIKKP
jgi:FKBP-type peptidyl-prolyl cis-trans isomerase